MLKGFGSRVRFSSTRRISLPAVEANELCKKSKFFIKLSLTFLLGQKGLTSSRRETISVLYSLLYGRALFSPVHCFQFMCLLFCKFCLLPEIRAEKIPRAEYASKQLSVKSLLRPKSSTDATSNEVMEPDDDEVEQKPRLNLSLLFNLIYKAIYRR